jgi:hypothetical protein
MFPERLDQNGLSPAGCTAPGAKEDNKDCLTRLIADMTAYFPNMVKSRGLLCKAYFEEMQ